MSIAQTQQPARHVSDYLSVAWRRKWLSMFIFVALATGGLFVVFRMLTPKYQAQSRVALERVSRIMETRAQDTEAFYQTQYQVIGSSQVAAAAAVKLGRAQSPELAIANGSADTIRRAVGIEPERENRVVRVMSKQPDPEAAALIVNAVVDAFGDITRQNERDRASKRQQDLLGEINKLEMEIEGKQKAIAQFAEDRKLQEQQHEKMLLDMRVQALSQNQVKTRVERERAEEEFALIKAKHDAGEDIVLIQPSATVQSMDNQIRAWEMHKAQIEDGRTAAGLANNLEYKQILAAIERTQAQRDKLMADDRRDRNQQAYKLYEEAVERGKRAEAKYDEEMVTLRGQMKALTEGLTELNRYEELRKDLAAITATRDNLKAKLIEDRINDTTPVLEVHILDRAKAPKTPAWPNKTQLAAVVTAMSLIIAVAFAFFLEYMDRTVRTPEDIEQDLRLPLIGFVPSMHAGSRNGKFGKVIATDPTSAPAEAYRKVRAKLFVYNKETHAKCFSVTSTTAGEGKTTLASNLAIAFSQSGARALLVDADLRHPTVQTIHEVEWAPGLGDYLAGMVEWREAVKASGIDNLSILPCGKGGSRSSELLENPRLVEFIKEAKEAYDVVVIDSPPVLGIADSTVLCNLTDATLFVVQARRNPKWLVRRAHGELKSAGAHILGAVLNRVRSQGTDYYHYDRYYPKK